MRSLEFDTVCAMLASGAEHEVGACVAWAVGLLLSVEPKACAAAMPLVREPGCRWIPRLRGMAEVASDATRTAAIGSIRYHLGVQVVSVIDDR